MTQKKWNTPPIIQASLRLKHVLYRLQQVELKRKMDRATGLLKTHLERVKKTNA
jgi:hypothetical protein